MATNKPKLGAKHVEGTKRIQRQLRRVEAEERDRVWREGEERRRIQGVIEAQRVRCERCDHRAMERLPGRWCGAYGEMQFGCPAWTLIYWETPEGKTSKRSTTKEA